MTDRIIKLNIIYEKQRRKCPVCKTKMKLKLDSLIMDYIVKKFKCDRFTCPIDILEYHFTIQDFNDFDYATNRIYPPIQENIAHAALERNRK